MSWSQTARRKLLGPHTFPPAGANYTTISASGFLLSKETKKKHLGSQAWQRLDSCCQEEFGYLTHAIGQRAKLGQVKSQRSLCTRWLKLSLRSTWSHFWTPLVPTFSTRISALWPDATMTTPSLMSTAQTLTRLTYQTFHKRHSILLNCPTIVDLFCPFWSL